MSELGWSTQNIILTRLTLRASSQMKLLTEDERADLDHFMGHIYDVFVRTLQEAKAADRPDLDFDFGRELNQATDHPQPFIIWLKIRSARQSAITVWGAICNSPEAFHITLTIHDTPFRWEVEWEPTKPHAECAERGRRFLQDLLRQNVAVRVCYSGDAPCKLELVHNGRVIMTRKRLVFNLWRRKPRTVREFVL